MILDMYSNKVIKNILQTMYSIECDSIDIKYKKGDKNILFSNEDIDYVVLHDNIKNEIADMKSKFNYKFAINNANERISIFISYDALFEYMANYEYSAAMIGFFKFVNENDIGIDILCDKNPLLILPEDFIKQDIDVFFPLGNSDKSKISKLEISKLKNRFGSDIDVEKIERFLLCYDTYRELRIVEPNCIIANSLYGGIALSILDKKIDKNIDRYIVAHPQYIVNYPNVKAIKECDEILDFIELLQDIKIKIICGNTEVYDILFKIVKNKANLIMANESGHNEKKRKGLSNERKTVYRDIMVVYRGDDIDNFNFAIKLLSLTGFAITIFVPSEESPDGIDKIMEDNMCTNYRTLSVPNHYLSYVIHQYNMLIYPYPNEVPDYMVSAVNCINTVMNIDANSTNIKSNRIEYIDVSNMIMSIKAVISLYGNPFDKNENTSEFKYGEGVFDEWKKIIKR